MEDNKNNEPKNTQKNQEYYDEHGIPKYDALIKYENEIRKEVEDQSPLISDKKDIQCLLPEFDNSLFIDGIIQITQKYSFIRTIRRDGNCFYRAFIFRLFEEVGLKRNKTLYDRLIKIVEDSKVLTEKQGYQWIVIEDFYNIFLKELQLMFELVENEITAYLNKLFTDQEKGNYLIVFVRLLIAAYLKENKILYECFIEDEFNSWVLREVEAIDNECDQVQIMAVVNAFNIGVKIEYLNPGILETMQFPEDATEIFIHMLFRPGHYDVLYPK